MTTNSSSLPCPVREQPDKCLVAQIVDQNAFQAEELESHLRSAWQLHGNFSVYGVAGARNTFVIHFDSEKDLRFIFEKAPWMVKNTFMAIQPWNPADSSLTDENTRVSAMWVQFNNVPRGRNDPEMAEYLGNIVGDPVFREDDGEVTYQNNSAESSLRVRVKVDLNLPLIQKIKPVFDDDDHKDYGWIQCSYKGVYRHCTKCGHIGHAGHGCKFNNKAKRTEDLNKLKERIRGKGHGGTEIDIKDEKPRDRRYNARKRTACIKWRAETNTYYVNI